jgi:hypothetical protein
VVFREAVLENRKDEERTEGKGDNTVGGEAKRGE